MDLGSSYPEASVLPLFRKGVFPHFQWRMRAGPESMSTLAFLHEPQNPEEQYENQYAADIPELGVWCSDRGLMTHMPKGLGSIPSTTGSWGGGGHVKD